MRRAGTNIVFSVVEEVIRTLRTCLLYTSDAADEEDSVDFGDRRVIKKKNRKRRGNKRHKCTFER